MYLGSSLRTITLRAYTLESGALQFLLHNVDHLLFQDDDHQMAFVYMQ